MAHLDLDFFLLTESAIMPTTSDESSPGVDLYSPIDVDIEPGEQVVIDTGVTFAILDSKIGLLKDKRSVVTKRKLKVDSGVIDAATAYRGSVKVALRNVGDESAHIKTGEPIAQMILFFCQRPTLQRVKRISTETTRGMNGFGYHYEKSGKQPYMEDFSSHFTGNYQNLHNGVDFISLDKDR